MEESSCPTIPDITVLQKVEFKDPLMDIHPDIKTERVSLLLPLPETIDHPSSKMKLVLPVPPKSPIFRISRICENTTNIAKK